MYRRVGLGLVLLMTSGLLWPGSHSGAQGASGSISGKVTAADTGQPLEGVCVRVWSGAAQSVTASDGTYTLADVPEGSHRILFQDHDCPPSPRFKTNPYAPQYYDGKTRRNQADLVSVGPGEQRTGIDAALVPDATVSGVVTDDQSGNPIPGTWVSIHTADFELNFQSETAGDGSYAVRGLSAGDYLMSVFPPADYVRQQFEVTIAESEQKTVDIQLQLGGRISGTVTSAADGSPLRFVQVSVIGHPGIAPFTGEDGTYVIRRVPPGQQLLGFLDEDFSAARRAYQYYDGALDVESATSVPVTRGEETTGIDVSLVEAGSVSGRVTAPGEEPLPGVCVFVRHNGRRTLASSRTGSDGRFSIPWLPSATFAVEFFHQRGEAKSVQFYDGKLTVEEADPVVVNAPQERQDVDGSVDATQAGTASCALFGATGDPQGPSPDPTPIPEAPDIPEPEGEAQVSSSEVEPGDEVTVSGDGFAPNEELDIYFLSEPQHIGTTQSDDNGAFQAAVTIPEDATPGPHQIIVAGLGPDGNRRSVASQVMVQGDEQASTPTPTPGPGSASQPGTSTGPGTQAALPTTPHILPHAPLLPSAESKVDGVTSLPKSGESILSFLAASLILLLAGLLLWTTQKTLVLGRRRVRRGRLRPSP